MTIPRKCTWSESNKLPNSTDFDLGDAETFLSSKDRASKEAKFTNNQAIPSGLCRGTPKLRLDSYAGMS